MGLQEFYVDWLTWEKIKVFQSFPWWQPGLRLMSQFICSAVKQAGVQETESSPNQFRVYLDSIYNKQLMCSQPQKTVETWKLSAGNNTQVMFGRVLATLGQNFARELPHTSLVHVALFQCLTLTLPFQNSLRCWACGQAADRVLWGLHPVRDPGPFPTPHPGSGQPEALGPVSLGHGLKGGPGSARASVGQDRAVGSWRWALLRPCWGMYWWPQGLTWGPATWEGRGSPEGDRPVGNKACGVALRSLAATFSASISLWTLRDSKQWEIAE